jgi:hypothetical protein
MDRAPNLQQDALIQKLPTQMRGVEVSEALSVKDQNPNRIEGYRFERVMGYFLFIQPCNEAMVVNRIMRLTTKPRLDRGRAFLDAYKVRIHDAYQTKAEPINHNRPKHLIVLPHPEHAGIVDFNEVNRIVSGELKGWIKPHPATTAEDLQMFEARWPGQIISATEKLYPYIRHAKRVWLTTQSEAILACMSCNKPFGFIDNNVPSPGTRAFRGLYTGMARSPSKLSLKEKLTTILSYPESGLIAVDTDHAEQDVNRFFTHFTLHHHGAYKG